MNKKIIQESINVMIIEDDDTYRNSICEVINTGLNMSCGHACESCEEALAILEKDFIPEIILLDIKLPGMSGLEGIRKIKAITPSTLIIMLTVFIILVDEFARRRHGRDIDRIKACRSGCNRLK